MESVPAPATTTVPMMSSDAVGVMSDSTRARLPRMLMPRLSSCLYPSDSSSAAPSTDSGGRVSAIDFPSVRDFWPSPPGGCSICSDLKAGRQLVRGRGRGEGLGPRRHGGGFGSYRPGDVLPNGSEYQTCRRY